MLIQPTPLGAQIATLRTAAATAPSGAAGRMLPACLHTMIAAILARIFGRLEQIFLLWQAGLLPPSPAPRSHARDTAPDIAERRPTASRPPRDKTLPATRQDHPRPQNRAASQVTRPTNPPLIHQRARVAPSRPLRPLARLARAPPLKRRRTRFQRPLGHSITAPESFRYRCRRN